MLKKSPYGNIQSPRDLKSNKNENEHIAINTNNPRQTQNNQTRVALKHVSQEPDKDPADEKKSSSDALFEKMMQTRTILLSGEIDKELAEKTVRQLFLMEAAGDGPIKVFIDSPGGDADAGFAIYDIIRFIKPAVYTIGMGLVASAAAIVLLASAKENRYGLPNSHFLIHQPLSGIRGVATDIEIHARELEKMRAKINKLISSETGRDLAKVEQETDRDYWMNAQEAVEYNLISKVINSRMDLEC